MLPAWPSLQDPNPVQPLPRPLDLEGDKAEPQMSAPNPSVPPRAVQSFPAPWAEDGKAELKEQKEKKKKKQRMAVSHAAAPLCIYGE